MSAMPPFVGRDRELATLTEALAAARASSPSLWLVTGVAGIGKTRLADELATRAAARGWQVARGQCWNEASTPPLWPWTQVVRRFTGAADGVDLAELVLADPDAVAGDLFALFDATATTLGCLAVEAPLLIVLDDLHHADPDTVRLARFVVAHLRDVPMLIITTYRRHDGAARADLAALVAGLERTARTIELGGLVVDEVAAMIGEGDAAAVRAATGGNPLFIRQLLEVGAPATASENDVGPDALGSLLRARLTGLDPDALTVVAAIAVLGPRADLAATAALAGVPVDAVDELVQSLASVKVLAPGALALAHPLLADAVDAVVEPDVLASLHYAAAQRCGGAVAERAYHLARAGDDHWADAVEACRDAAAAASAALSHDAAVTHLERALALLADRGEAAAEFEVAFALAVAIERTRGSVAADDAYRRAYELASRTGDPMLVARAAARSGIAFYADQGGQPVRAADCRAALADMRAGAEPLRVRLLANLVAADPNEPRRVELADEAVADARRLDDPKTLAIALVAQQVADLGPSTLSRRLHTSREIVALAEASNEADLAVRGRFLLQNALLEAGDMRGLDAELVAQDRSITEIAETRFARHTLWFRCMRAMLDGRAAAVEALASECLRISETLLDPDGFGVYTGQYGVALWLQGRLAELEPVYTDLMRNEPDEPLWPAVVGWIALHDGRPEAARGMLDRLPAPADLPQGMHTLLNLFTFADVGAAVGDDPLVGELRDVLLPYADRAVPIAMGAACFGVVARPLGHLALRLGLVDEAIGHLDRAIAVTARMGARPWLVDAQLALAETLVAHERGDDPRIAALVNEAAATTDALGLHVFAERLAHMRGHCARRPCDVTRPVEDLSAERPATAPATATVSVLGAFEVRALDGTVPHWTSRKARSLLKLLVARRGAPIAREQVMDHLWPTGPPASLANRLAVAVSTVRRALDPQRSLPADAMVRADGGTLQLMLDHVDVDVETFLTIAEGALAAHRDDQPTATRQLCQALATYRGEALPDEPYEPWADALRATAAGMCARLLRALADRAERDGDGVLAADSLRRLLELDPYDAPAHRRLVDVLDALGAYGQAGAARERYAARMAELGLPASTHGSD